MTDKINVLDYGFVRLVDHMGNDLSIVRNARVSYNADWRTGEDDGKDEKLIRYLYRNQHNTPFESVTFTFDIKAPIFVIRQWHRHRTWAFNEVSARYTVLPDDYYVPKANDVGAQSVDNKQVRELDGRPDGICPARAATAIRRACEKSFSIYQGLIDSGVPRELARTVLPLATYSHFFGTVNLHNLFRFISERIHPHAQYEIRVYAEALLELITPIVPVAVSAFNEARGVTQ